MRIGKQKQVNASYQTSLVNRHIRRFTGFVVPNYERGRRPSEFSLNTRGVQKVRGPTKKENEFYDGTRCEGCDVIKTVPDATTTQSVLLFCSGCWLL